MRFKEFAKRLFSSNVFYHGTNRKFEKFSLDKLRNGADKGATDSWYGDGIYLTGEVWKAYSYGYNYGKEGLIATAKVDLSKPFVVSGTSIKDFHKALKKINQEYEPNNVKLTKTLKSLGYDCTVILSDQSNRHISELVVFDPSNIDILNFMSVEKFRQVDYVANNKKLDVLYMGKLQQ